MSELFTVGLANWFSALPITIPMLLVLAVIVWRREQRR